MIGAISFQDARAGWRSLLASFRTLVSGEVAARALGFLSVFVLARALTPAGFGIVTLGTTLVLFLRLVVDAGTEVLNVRQIAREPGRLREIVEPILGLRLALSIPATALLAAAVLVAAKPGADRIALGAFALILPMTALNLRWMVIGVGGSKAIAVGNVAKELVILLGVLALVHRAHDTVVVALLMAGGELVGAVILLDAMRRRYGLLRPRVDLTLWRRNLRASRPIALNSIARTVVYSFDVLLIAVLLDRRSVGLYTAAYKPVLFAVTCMAIFFMAFLASYSAATGDDARQLFRRTVATAVGGTVAAALALSLGSSAFSHLAYGDGYGGAAAPLAILAWTLPVLAVSAAYSNALVAAHREDVVMRNNVVGAVFNVAANAVAIPLLGIGGAAAVTVCSELLILTLMARAVVNAGLERSPGQILRDFARWHRHPRRRP